MSKFSILIVGAGPAGLIMALFLAKSGIKSRIIDKDPNFHTVRSRGFGIQPRTLELLQTLGLLPDVQAAATPIPTMRAYKLPGGMDPVKTWDLYEKGRVWPDRPHANGACLQQSTLEEIIRAHLARYGVTVERSRELVEIKQDSDGVTATIIYTQTGGKEEVRVEYLVGADGARGPTRKLLGLTFEGETKDTDGMVWGDVEIEGLGSDYWHIWGKPGHFTRTHLRIMARPITPGEKKFGIGITGLNFDPIELADETKTKAFIREQTGRTDLELGQFSWLSYFKPNMRMVNKFAEGRVFIVGDAAHVHSPTGIDSNLAWKLALVLKRHAPPSLLETYTAERLPVVAQMLLATSALYTHTIAKAPKAEKTEPENEKASGWFRWRNTALEMYGINYRYSPIIFTEGVDRAEPTLILEELRARAYEGYEGSGTLCAGDRAPEAPGLVLNSEAGNKSLFGLINPAMHNILIFIPHKKAIATLEGIAAAVVAYPPGTAQTFIFFKDHETLGGRNGFVDRDGHAFAAYLVKDDCRIGIVVVRPDGFIGAVVGGVEGMDRYFRTIFWHTN
ncbi:FAD binding domain-containing protein [Mycena rosella]|uniref:FAD binding domain-containing protein n=1 Tax=Mycena rosella TaxID=1033263 RepID=A0AAD7D5J3_MYCRO|nr:FAD binding domain-containing protein [Mycena rosella]